MDGARTPWAFQVHAAWYAGAEIYVVFTTTVTGDRMLGDVLNTQESLTCYGANSATDLAHLMFAVEIQSHPYYEIPAAPTACTDRGPIYWFAATDTTDLLQSVDDIEWWHRHYEHLRCGDTQPDRHDP